MVSFNIKYSDPLECCRHFANLKPVCYQHPNSLTSEFMFHLYGIKNTIQWKRLLSCHWSTLSFPFSLSAHRLKINSFTNDICHRPYTISLENVPLHIIGKLKHTLFIACLLKNIQSLMNLATGSSSPASWWFRCL